MTFDIVARAKALADLLDAHPQTKAYHDPAKALANRPCLLVLPPTVDHTEGSFTGPEVTWRIAAVSSFGALTLDALKEIQKLLEAAREVLDVERETPARYTFGPDGKNVAAAYLCTHTEIA